MVMTFIVGESLSPCILLTMCITMNLIRFWRTIEREGSKKPVKECLRDQKTRKAVREKRSTTRT